MPKPINKTIDVRKAACGFVVVQFDGGTIELAFDRASGPRCAEVRFHAHVPTDEHLFDVTVRQHPNVVAISAVQPTADKIVLEPDPPGPTLLPDFTGTYAILSQKKFRGDLIDRVVLCTGGSGCRPNCGGTRVFGVMASTGEEFDFRCGDFTRAASPDEIKAAVARRGAA